MPYSADIYFLVCCPKSRQSWVQELLTFPVPQNHLSQCLLCSKHALTWSNLWPLCQESAPGYRIGKQLLEPLHSTGIGISGMLWEIPGAVVWRERGAGCELWEKQEHLFFPPLAKELPFTFSLYFCDGLNSLDEKWVSCYEKVVKSEKFYSWFSVLPEQGLDLHTIRAPGHIPSPHLCPEMKQAVTKRSNLWALNNSRDFHALLLFFVAVPWENPPPATHTGLGRGGASPGRHKHYTFSFHPSSPLAISPSV